MGFSIQMLRAEANNSPFVFVYMRRLFILYLFGAAQQILAIGGPLGEYAMVGVLLLLLHKLPRKFLILLAVLCFLVPVIRNNIKWQKIEQIRTINLQQSDKINQNLSDSVAIDTSVFDKYVGVYERSPGRNIVITREGNKIYYEYAVGKSRLSTKPQNDSLFSADYLMSYTFTSDSTGNVKEMVMHFYQGGNAICPRKQIDILQAQQEFAQIRTGIVKEDARITYKQFVVDNASEFWQDLKNWSWKNFFWRQGSTLSLFLIGLYFGRRKIFYDISSNHQFLQKLMWWGFLIGATGVAINLGFEAWNFINEIPVGTYSFWTRQLMNLSWDFGVIIMALAYVAGLTLLLEKINWRKRLSFFVPVGRMGLTNYLLYAVAATVIFESFGLNLAGKVGTFWRLILALPVFALMIIISHWWFKRFRIGPAEWLWRSLTYLKIQPMWLKKTDKSKEKEYGNI
jgi:uncharacterized membrane protein YeiB